jgi:acetolactate synthase-1/2/3 large subunit
MKASDLFVKALENEKVEYIFGIPGEENIDFMESLRKSKKIKFVTVRHEQGAAFMANVYGRLTGKPGVCLSTLGPGATNLITGVADAFLDSAPLVAVTGQSSFSGIHKSSHQYIDVVDIMKSITKWNITVSTPHTIPEIVRKAFKIAGSERFGPTHIELPEDIARENSNARLLKVKKFSLPRPLKEDIANAMKLIKNSANPIILAGNGIIRGNASSFLQEFAEKNSIPVTETFMSKGVLPEDHELNLLTVGLGKKDFSREYFEAADLVIAVGYDLVEYSPVNWNPKKNKKIIHIAASQAEVDEYYVPELEIVADIKETLIRLSKKQLRKRKAKENKIQLHVNNTCYSFYGSCEFPLKPQRVICDLRALLKKEDLIVSDVGAHKLWIARFYRSLHPNSVIISNGFASMGIALPGAIAAKLVYPERNVVAVTGDGGLLMNIQELETAKRLNLNFVVLIFSDSKYGVIKWHQEKRFKKSFGVDFTNPSFVELAESFGVKGYKIKKANELFPVMQKALNDNTVSLIDVPIDYSESLKV